VLTDNPSGTNDAGWGVSQDDFSKAYVKFITRIKNECGPSLKHIIAMVHFSELD
jgi:hypothetical protein